MSCALQEHPAPCDLMARRGLGAASAKIVSADAVRIGHANAGRGGLHTDMQRMRPQMPRNDSAPSTSSSLHLPRKGRVAHLPHKWASRLE